MALPMAAPQRHPPPQQRAPESPVLLRARVVDATRALAGSSVSSAADSIASDAIGAARLLARAAIASSSPASSATFSASSPEDLQALERALQDALIALEGPQCVGVGLVPSGLSAISTALLSVLKAGDHVLVCDNVYRPTRNFCNGLLTRYGVETTYFDPLIGAWLAESSR